MGNNRNVTKNEASSKWAAHLSEAILNLKVLGHPKDADQLANALLDWKPEECNLSLRQFIDLASWERYT